ncbi:BTB/POZ domain-containing protein 29 [Elsinoe australis]|uniref:BTB/POZ domain-containing protein 29 n=1 Tax=Elsinoe australis TaxID=40998 RepID=A0A4U7AS21_9PEZI|nr:BTB/POZ domain-containing protein 29 [Elsinoe australis]
MEVADSYGSSQGDKDSGREAWEKSYINRFNDTVTFIVGEEIQVFNVNKMVITKISPFFRAAFDGAWTESSSKTMELPDIEPILFAALIDWAYSGSIISEHAREGPIYSLTARSLVQLHIMADRFQIPGLKNATNDGIFDIYTDLFKMKISNLHDAFDKLPENSTLQCLLIDMWIRGEDRTGTTIKLVESLPKMALRLINAYESGANAEDEWNKSDYHEDL